MMIVHSIVMSMAVKPSPDPEVRKKTVAVPNPDSWSDNKMAAELSKKGGAQEVQKWRERYQQQQAQKDFKREVCPSLLVCKCAAGPTYMCAAGAICMSPDMHTAHSAAFSSCLFQLHVCCWSHLHVCCWSHLHVCCWSYLHVCCWSHLHVCC